MIGFFFIERDQTTPSIANLALSTYPLKLVLKDRAKAEEGEAIS